MAADDPSREVDDWLAGLAGRPGSGPDHREGEQLRAAFDAKPAGPAAQPEWAAIEREALARQVARPAVTLATGHVMAPRQPAANDRQLLRWWPAAAALLMALGLWLMPPPGEQEPALRGDARSGAEWVVDNPLAQAQGLATELRALGAEVTILPDASSGTVTRVTLQIRVPSAQRQAIDRRLSALDTALTPSGELSLVVRAP